jgi:hypothetical protein
MQGGDKLTLNLNGGISAASTVSQLASPTTPKLCNLPSTIPLIPTPIEKNINKNESVTVTHFSDLHGGVVEKISVPVTSGSSSFMDTEQKSPKMEFSTTRTSISNNPFADEILNTSKTIISTTTSPTVKISTNNPFHSSFNGNDASTSDKSVKISFSILGTKNPFDENNTSEESNGIEAQLNNSNDSNNNRSNGDNDQSIDDVDSENLTSISSVNLKIDKNNENNITMIKMESTDKKQANGEINTTAKKVKHFFIPKNSISSLLAVSFMYHFM